MNKSLRAIIPVLLVIATAFSLNARETSNFNGGWRYLRGDHPGAEATDFDDSRWSLTGIPHSFSIPYFMSRDFYVGYGWYRKRFNIAHKPDDSRIILEFDGVFQEAEVFVNGQPLGHHVGGYTGFEIDITDAITEGNNLMAVRVNNIWHPDVAPRAGEHTFSGGIYRNVRLTVKNQGYIPRYGVAVSTPGLARSGGKITPVAISTEVVNASQQPERYTLRNIVCDNGVRILAEVDTQLTVNPGDTCTVSATTPPIENPELWSVEKPVRYRLVSNLYRGDTLIDSDTTRFGFRWTEWTPDRGFFLNGNHLYLQGANVHQDHAGWGDAVTDAAAFRDVKMMKDAGFNFIRGSHYPHSPAFSEACDSLGILLWSEAPLWGIGGFKPDGYWNSGAYPIDPRHKNAFEESALQQLAEMIRIHRNHPSIIAWSMCNEAFFSAPEAMDGVRHLLRRMVAESHRLDPTRPAGVGGVQRPLGDGRIDRIGDVAGYNGDGATIEDFINPGIPSMVSEYGSITAERPGEYSPGWRSLEADEAWRGHPWRAGQSIWCGFDHGSIAGAQLGKMGIVDYFRIPKRAWYWYRNYLNGTEPPAWPAEGMPSKLRLTSSADDFVRADGTDDVHLLVEVLDAQGRELSNSPDVALHILSGPGEFPTGRSIKFSNDSDIRILAGKAAIEMRAYRSGHTIVEATADGLEPARIEIDFAGGIDPSYREPELREYIRFHPTESEDVALLTFGQNNPMFASSMLSGHASGLAGDGDATTWWESDSSDHRPHLTLDTEKGLILQQISIRFPEAARWNFKVEISLDGETWATIADSSKSPGIRESYTLDCKGNENAQFIRIAFEGRGAVAELSVTGKILD